MVVSYLEKIKARYIEEQMEWTIQLNKLKKSYKEITEFISKLEEENDSNYEVFTPRMINSYNKDKIMNLLEEKDVIEEKMEKMKIELDSVEKEISEITRVISVAKRKRM